MAFTLWLFTGAAILVGLTAILGRAFGRNYLSYRGARVITCPENQRAAGVRLSASHALWTAIEGKRELRLASCSRWPERQGCGQDCLRQIEASPDGCLVQNILTKWYQGKDCALCGKAIGEINWAEHKPALLNAAHQTILWSDIQPQDLPDVLATHQPVCWNCHIVNTMIVEHPDLVVDRSRHV